jgi:hypothetical protein
MFCMFTEDEADIDHYKNDCEANILDIDSDSLVDR